jgi:predicted small lipoprotein YifL
MKVRTPNAMSVVAGVILGTLVACGAVGPPIAPENVGVTPTIERQKQLDALDEKQREAAAAAESTQPQPDPMLPAQDIDLPPVQPLGNR